jgi:hypothetical protein
VPWKYRPHDGSGITSPLKASASWSFASENINGDNGNIWRQTGRSKVVGQEAITTKAGTFDAFKIETVVFRSPTKDPTRKVEITQQTWYAPAIDHWVKRTLVTRADKHLWSITPSSLSTTVARNNPVFPIVFSSVCIT